MTTPPQGADEGDNVAQQRLGSRRQRDRKRRYGRRRTLIIVSNSDGTRTKWLISGGYGPGDQRFWWPGYQPNMKYTTSPIADMVDSGETVTITGVECDRCGMDEDRRTATIRPLTVFEITRGGR